MLYDYDHVDPAPLAEHGRRRSPDTATWPPLLTEDDDRLCLVGPGDEVRLEFDARRPARPAPTGWTRSYVLRAVGYCKDADPFTAASDTVGPLPWEGMPPTPSAGDRRPDDPAYREYLETYQTRRSGSR